VEHLPKYYYKPILEKVASFYLENSQTEYAPEIEIESTVSLVIEAETEEIAQKAAYGFIDVRMWELDQTI
jgi:hypothetical protein